MLSNLALVAIVIWVIYSVYKHWENSKPEKKVEELEASAVFWKEQALKDLLHLGKAQLEFVLDATERDYLHLKEQFKHDEKKQFELASDWCEYTKAINDLSYAGNMLDVDMSQNAYENYGETAKEPHIKRHEIERRFQTLRGEKLQDRWDQWGKMNPNPLDEVFRPVGQEE